VRRNDLKEEEIRKREVFNKYLELVEEDVKTFFDFSRFEVGPCPACGDKRSVEQFKKLGFNYVSCKNCNTLFVNPRPPFSVLDEFYSRSPSTNFWVNEFFKPVAQIRREKIFKPRAQDVAPMIPATSHLNVGDIGAGFGLFLEELRKLRPDSTYYAIEPSVEMAGICRSLGLEVRQQSVEDVKDLDGSFDILTAFELFEHLHNPSLFLKKINGLLKPGGHLVLTTLNGEGFDILLLWERSKSVSPPHHLNFFNTGSIAGLMKNNGFEIISVTTPGKLDWDIVDGMIKKEKASTGKLWDKVALLDEKAKSALQKWISESNMSSHMRVVARKVK